jgi:YbbR domain-containing protein
MAFRNTDEGASSLARLPREARSWLHEIFLEDWTLKLLALAITLGLWYGVTGQRAPQTIRLPRVQLDFQLPNDMEISNDPRREVDITVTGSKHALDQINMRDLIARVDVQDYKPGERVVQLTRQRVKLELPDGVRIEKIEPSTVPLRLEQSIETEVDVEVRREGTPAPGCELRGITLTPSRIKVRGPASHVNALQKVMTETIPLDGRKESFTVMQAAIDIPDPKVNIMEPVVNVSIEIGEQRVEKSFAGVSVMVRDQSEAQARPPSAIVTLYGPKSALDQLRADQLKVILIEGEDGSVTPQIELPPELQSSGIELRSTKPSGFSITK